MFYFVTKRIPYLCGFWRFANAYQVLVSEGRNVKQGAPLLKFDKAFIEGKGLAADCILVLTNTDDFPDVKFISGMDAKQSETVICTF